MEERLTHLDAAGQARMVDVGAKAVTARSALAQGRVRMRAETLQHALSGNAKKGDVCGVARLAGIMAGKRTAELIPLCHHLPLNKIDVEIEADAGLPGFIVRASASTNATTGVEMEALTAVSVACLTLYDMLKAIDRAMCIEAVELVEKRGGASGDYRRTP